MQLDFLVAFIASLVITLLVMPGVIRYLHKIKFGQTEREEGLASHKVKNGTPTMGGLVFIIVPVLVFAILQLDALRQNNIQIVILAYLGYGLIGFIDDYLIVVKKNNDGLKPGVKFAMQSVLAVVFFLLYQASASTEIMIPILDIHFDLGWFYFFLVFIMFTAESNAVNLTDGLDGLCAGVSIIALFPYVIFSLLQGNRSLAVLLLCIIGALLGYLRFNLHPAKIFMGDTGSLALGGLLAAVAMVTKEELLLIMIGGVFVIEVLSVVIQVTYFKRTGKRVFKMAPIHHHFEMCGMKETKVVSMFWGIGLILALIGLFLGVM
uniref:phospho-N-acetylmuramoyl-pentapeptide- transferase n=1 Tax=Merdibacter massiliensis TaxID=1871030 RepID=UPI00096A334C|nr:phospho-N-acetylmuramoyl-pentapeptide-transferase [Merdibacter massiliensis]